jgi:hypothetical protein
MVPASPCGGITCLEYKAAPAGALIENFVLNAPSTAFALFPLSIGEPAGPMVTLYQPTIDALLESLSGSNLVAQPTRKVLKVVRPERFELPTFWFVARRSIQLS